MKFVLNKATISLAISAVIVIPAGFIYGFYPKLIVKITPQTATEWYFYKATMVLYITFGLYWLFAIVNVKHFKSALILNFLFMTALVLSRFISYFFHGFANSIFSIGTIGEIVLATYALFQIQKIKD